MRQPAAKKGDRIVGTDIHIVMVPDQPSPMPLPHPFTGVINGGLSSDVNIMGMPAAVVGSTADNTPQHVPTPPGTSFQNPPANKATIQCGSATVRINGKLAARGGDTALTCNDPLDLSSGTVLATGTVTIG
jgi:uncharacterized Zn-binding protein involved in type VI secretion